MAPFLILLLLVPSYWSLIPKKQSPGEPGLFSWSLFVDQAVPTTASSRIATMLMILIIGLTAGPAVSL